MRSIFKQSSYLFMAQVFARAIGFFYTIFLAKNLGPENFGLFSTALAFYALLSVVGEFGFNRFLTKEIAQDKENTNIYLANVAFFRLILTTILFCLIALYLYFFDPDKIRANLTTLALLAIFPVALAQTVDACFVALQKLQYSAIALVSASIFTTLLGFLLVSLEFGATGPVLALILGQLIYFIILLALFRNQHFKIFSSIKIVVIKQALIGSLPYGILGVLGLLYFRIDTLLISYLRGNFETGIYSAAYKFLEAAVIIPASASLAIFPVMINIYDKPKELKKIYIKTILVTATLGVIISLIFFFILPIIIKALLPSYLASIDVIKILAISIPFMFIHIPASQVLLASNKYLKSVIILTLLLLISNVSLNLMLIPKMGYLGAAWVTVISDILSLLAVILFIHKKIFKDI